MPHAVTLPLSSLLSSFLSLLLGRFFLSCSLLLSVMSYYDELDKVLAMSRDRPAGLIPRKSGIDLPRDSEGERLSLSSDPPKKPRLSAHGTTPNPRHCSNRIP